MADFEVTPTQRKEPSILDVDWQHEGTEPTSEHETFHPVGGEPPSVETPDNVFDIDFHPDPRSGIYGGYDAYNDKNPNVDVSRTAVLDSDLARQGEQLQKAQREVEIAQLKQQVATLRNQANAINRAQKAASIL